MIKQLGTLYAALVIATIAAICYMHEAEANHFVWLPGLCGQDVRTCPTPVMLKARERGYVTYAFDARSAAYPNFRQQALDVAFAGKDAGLPEAREVASNPDIWLTMPVDSTFISTCGAGAAGCILYWNDPIIVYFRMALFYSDWRTTIGHEGLNYGHAMGEHERYFDNGEFRCDTTATYTVMSCGTGVWRPQPFDIQTVCMALQTSWCGVVKPPPPECVPTPEAPCWMDGRWRFSDGWSFDPAYGNCGAFYDAADQLVWGNCDTWGSGARWNDLVKRWLARDGGVVNPDNGTYGNTNQIP